MKYFTPRRIGAIVLLVVAVMGLISLTQVEAWDGGFRQAEFRIRFVDLNGKPINGIKLTVTDAAGKAAFCYPVTDYHQDSAPTSDNDGLMIYHHINLSPEFSGKSRRLFFLFPIGQRSSPIYYCRFLKDNRVVTDVVFNDYLGYSGKPEYEWSQLPKSRKELKTMNVNCKSSQLSEHIMVQHRPMDNELEFPVIEKTITTK